MSSHIMFCRDCMAYTLGKECPECRSKTASPHPPRFSPEDKYGKYRRRLMAMSRGGE